MNRRKILLAIILLTWSLAPLIWQVYTSFTYPEDIIRPITISSIINHKWTLVNYIQVLQSDPPIWKYLVNSTIVGIASTFFTLFIGIPAAYSIIRLPKNNIKIVRLFCIKYCLIAI